MDNIIINPERQITVIPNLQTDRNDQSAEKHFIVANTISGDFKEIYDNHLIPVFIKDNEPLISHGDFITSTLDAAKSVFVGEQFLTPNIRLSHPIKGRIPEAKDKPASELQDFEKTIYYERMAFIIEIPSITGTVGGNQLNLVVGGVKAYNTDNLYGRKGSDEHFKLFVGFENKVCTNLCVWTDGISVDVKVQGRGQLVAYIKTMLESYNQNYHLFHLNEFCNYKISEQQFATLIGRCRMYNHLPAESKASIPALLFGDTQIGAVCREYYKDDSFCRDEDGSIDLWKLYNLFTGSNKSTYIDSFVERSSSAFQLVYSLKQSLQNQTYNWYLN